MSEQERIKAEIAYYSALIENHRKRTNVALPLYQQSLPGSSSSSSTRRLVVPATKTGFFGGTSTSSKRTVVRTENNNRTVILANKSSYTTNRSGNDSGRRVVITSRQMKNVDVPQANASKFVWHNKQANTTSTSVLQKAAVKHKIAHSVSEDASSATKRREVSTSSRTVLSTKQTSVRPVDAARPSTSGQMKSSIQSVDNKALVKSRYKLVKKSASAAFSSVKLSDHKIAPSKSGSRPSTHQKTNSKYKLVRNSPRNPQPSKRRPTTGTGSGSPYLSKSGKRLISKYKIRRRSKELRTPYRVYPDQHASPHLKSRRGGSRVSRFRLDRRVKTSPYKIDKLAHTRKPLTPPYNKFKAGYQWKSGSKSQWKTSSRSQWKVNSRYQWTSASLLAVKTFISPYKLNRQRSFTAVQRSSLPRHQVVRQIAGRALQRSAALSLKAKYKKNNTNDKHCLFFMRFGKCNRGDKCFYIHDPERIAICTRYLRGTCDIENCPFSHEAKKEKVPVCQHFLRGCCLRDNCPYLHVNVGKNAPICKNFAQHRYCHLGERCKKLHTDICPERDDSGTCPKGRRCRLRHPKKINKSESRSPFKQRKPAASTFTEKVEPAESVEEGPVVPSGEKLTSALPAYISLLTSQSAATDAPARPVTSHKAKKLKTKPSFLE